LEKLWEDRALPTHRSHVNFTTGHNTGFFTRFLPRQSASFPQALEGQTNLLIEQFSALYTGSITTTMFYKKIFIIVGGERLCV
ncbi:MAG TPA: hypothetical protein VG603_06005, partial [Chitinophagales bacterium]|nr:hypothetical protein [Chitinophagales bacterium]